jgi:hypothetical protein
MKPMTTIMTLLLYSILSQAQTAVGIDLTSLLFNEVRVAVGHRISERWTVSASAGINRKVLKRDISSEEADHNSDFPPAYLPEGRSFSHRESIGLSYWPQSSFSGPFLTIGGEYRQGLGLDATLGAGYMFTIWKGIIGTLKYDAGIIRTANTGKLPADGFSVGLCWKF